MQITIDLSVATDEQVSRAIDAIRAYRAPRFTPEEIMAAHAEPGRMMSDADSDAALAKLRATIQDPKPQEVAAPSTVAATPPVSAPEAAQVFAQVPTPVPAPPAPPAAPMAAVPTPPAAPTTPANVDVDTEGLPWDARIHASTKTKTQAGVWKKRKGLADDVDQDVIKRELFGVMQLPLPLSGGVLTAANASAPTSGVPPAPAPAGSPTTLVQLMPLVTKAMLAQTVPATALLEAVSALGLPSIPSLAQRPDMVPQVWELLVSQYPVLGAV